MALSRGTLRNGVEAENGRVAVFETKANTVEEPVETSALDTKQGFESRAWEATKSYVMSLSFEYPSHHR